MKKFVFLALLSLIATLVLGSEVNNDQEKVLEQMGFKNYNPEQGKPDLQKPGQKKMEKAAATKEIKPSEEEATVSGGDVFATVIGPCGYITVPTQKLLNTQTCNAGMHVYYPSSQGKDRLAEYMKFNYGFNENFEFGATKCFTTLSGMSNLDPYFSFKARLKEDFILGGILDTSSLKDDIKYKNSYYFAWGQDTPKCSYTLGGGINTGKKNCFAHFGSANSSDSQRGFFLAGSSFKLSDNLQALMDFNGDFYSYGLRYSEGNFAIDMDVIQKADNLALLPISGGSKTVFGLSMNF
ncbi:MAG: hypothetical protein PHW04_03190 [Candidatus Wallbacteria bacterium]|nr:hypothetical protein [Candidatus Wallbacteria bacterium]